MGAVDEFNHILSDVKLKIINHDTLKTQDLTVLEELVGVLLKLHNILENMVLKRKNDDPEADALERLFAPCLQKGITDDEKSMIRRSLRTNLIEYPYTIYQPPSAKVSPL